MRRKIVKHGPSSLTITLPMPWAKKNRLKNGDEVEVTDKGKELVVSGHGAKESKEITITLSGKKELVKRVFVMPYVRGYDVINIHFDDYTVLEFIQRNMDLLFGFEIVEQKSDFCRLKNVAETKPEEFDSMLARMFNICTTVLEEICDFMQKGDKDALKRIALMERTMDRIDLFCSRIVNSAESGIEIRKAGSTYAIVRILEGLSDIANCFATDIPNLKIEHKKEFYAISKDILDGFMLLRKIKYKGNLELLYDYKILEKRVGERIAAPLKLGNSERRALSLLEEAYHRLHHLSEEVILWCSHE